MLRHIFGGGGNDYSHDSDDEQLQLAIAMSERETSGNISDEEQLALALSMSAQEASEKVSSSSKPDAQIQKVYENISAIVSLMGIDPTLIGDVIENLSSYSKECPSTFGNLRDRDVDKFIDNFLTMGEDKKTLIILGFKEALAEKGLTFVNKMNLIMNLFQEPAYYIEFAQASEKKKMEEAVALSIAYEEERAEKERKEKEKKEIEAKEKEAEYNPSDVKLTRTIRFELGLNGEEAQNFKALLDQQAKKDEVLESYRKSSKPYSFVGFQNFVKERQQLKRYSDTALGKDKEENSEKKLKS